ncbi:MAG: hypothetical protein ABSG80_05165 [Verrucomicrobiota bacterium]
MKLAKNPIVHFSLAILCAGLAGCMIPNPVAPLGSGYEEKGHPNRSSPAPADTRVSFQYRAPDGKIALVWPSLYGVGEVIKGDVAIFVGDRAYVSPDPNDPRGTKPRLFAVRSPALPLDITDEVLWQWSKKSGKDFAKALDRFSMVTPEEKNGQLELHLEFWTEEKDWPDTSTLQLEWNQVFDIMREVKKQGVMRQDLRWGTPCIEIILSGKSPA